MVTPSSTFSFKRFFVLFLSAIVLVISLELMLFGSENARNFFYYFSNAREDDALRFAIKIRNIEKENAPHKVFFIGPSLVREDFDERWFNLQYSDEKISFYNLGLAGAAPIDIWMIRNNFIRLKPDLIVYMPYIGNFFEDYDLKRMRNYFSFEIVKDMQQLFGWNFIFKNWFIFFDSQLATYSKLYRYRESIGTILFTAINEKLFPWTAELQRPMLYSYKKNKTRDYFFQKIKELEGKQFYVSKFTSLEKEKFTAIMRSFQETGIKTAIINPPVHPLMDKTYSKEVGAAFNAFLKDQATFFNCPYLSEHATAILSQEQYFSDFTHLNSAGREVFVEFVSNWLEEQGLLPSE